MLQQNYMFIYSQCNLHGSSSKLRHTLTMQKQPTLPSPTDAYRSEQCVGGQCGQCVVESGCKIALKQTGITGPAFSLLLLLLR